MIEKLINGMILIGPILFLGNRMHMTSVCQMFYLHVIHL